jgi:putative FmdB family regulatory protein
MELYQYQCRKCSHFFKKNFLILEDAPFACPQCGDIQAKRALNYATLSPEIGIGRADQGSAWDLWTELTSISAGDNAL